MSPAGYVLLAMVASFFLYLLPLVIRSRQVVVDSRVEDRFSEELRVVATAGQTQPEDRPISTTRGYVHRPRPQNLEASMDRPVALNERLIAADARRAAAARAARAAAASRRAAAAKRRLALTLFVLGVTAVAWTLFAMSEVAIGWAVAPSVLLLGVMVLGRRAAAASAVADARWQESLAADRRAAELGRAGRAKSALALGAEPVAASPQVRAARAADTVVTPRLRIDVDPASSAVAEAAPLRAQGVALREGAALPEGEGWTPVPVPAPTYTLKPAAPRREVAPFSAADEAAAAAEASTAAATSADVAAVEELVASAAATAQAAEVVSPSGAQTPAMNLQAVLERRRAVGQ